MAAAVSTSVLVVDKTVETVGINPSRSSSPVAHINSINELLLYQAQTIPNAPLLAYPANDEGHKEWNEYTARDLDNFTDEAAKELTSLGLVPEVQHATKTEVVALLGPSDFDYAIAMMALSRMGFAVLFLSTRLPVEAYIALLDKTDCHRIVTVPRFEATVAEIQTSRPLHSFPLIRKSVFARLPSGNRFRRRVEIINEESTIAFIIHSSGSTGLPKPIFQTHRACLQNYAVSNGMRAFITLPLFHNSGIATIFRGIVAGKRTGIYNAALPLTNSSLLDAMNAMLPDSFHCVPYILKILAETPEGIEALVKCKIVVYGGSSCPDELGDLLVNAGVYLVGHYGQTEMGQLMISKRPADDKAWNYMRPLPDVKPFLHMEPIGDGQYEAVVLDGLPTKVISNSDNPPNSYNTRDCFIPHPTIPDAWKYIGRLDDRLTLVNGEKVLPVPIENRIRQDELVAECVVFGAEQAFPGIIVIPSTKADSLSETEFLDRTWPSIEAANANAEKFSILSREMVVVLPSNADYPRTDKGTAIRAQVYRRYSHLIEDAYKRFEEADTTNQLELDVEGLQGYLLDLFQNKLQMKEVGLDTDFFSAGMDSLQAIVTRGHIMRQLALGGNILGQNVVFENPNIIKLSKTLYSLRTGTDVEQEDEIELMNRFVEKYGAFRPFTPGSKTPEADVVVLTGTTGSLGAHVLAQLLPQDHIRQIYCLVRAEDPSSARERVLSSLSPRGLSSSELDYPIATKLIALPADLSQPSLGLPAYVLETLKSTVTSIIHSAWAVNFNMGVGSFETQHIAGTRNLLDLALSVPFTKPARFAFISSVSSAAGTPIPATVAETFVSNPAHAQGMGYARSKWVAESLVRRAALDAGMGAHARVLRTGQIVGDAATGRWNSTEAIPLMLRAAVTLGALPALDETPSWIPVDECAKAVIELSKADEPFSSTPEHPCPRCDEGADVVYHVLNPRRFRWTEDLLPALKAAGLDFEIVPQRDWVRRLREAEDQDPRTNPTVKLVDFFARKYDNDEPGRKGLLFATERTEKRSRAVWGRYDIINSGLMSKCVSQWSEEWNIPKKS